MNRRQFVSALGVFPFATSLTTLARPAMASVRMGEMVLTSVSDGSLVLPDEFFFSMMPEKELAEIRTSFDLTGDQIAPPCNAALLQTPERNILFDVGAGQDFMPTAGALIETLETLDLAPEDITDIVFTHAHPDHLWGLLDDFDDLVFTDANFYMGQTEFDYWVNPETVNQIGDTRASFAVGARRRLAMIADQINLFRDGEEILPGVAARACFGHTPGHMAFEVRSGNDATMILGDSIANHHVAFVRPDWHSGADQDPVQAAKIRSGLLDQLAQEKTRILGYHLPGGGFGRVEQKDSTFQFVGEGA